MTSENAMRRPVGAVLHSPRLYDALLWLSLRGREQQLRRRFLELIRLRPGESVLDVGCGTGTLAILAKAVAGGSGLVCAVDPSREMIERARSKAARPGADVRFETAAAQALPFADASFDLALATIMLHHLGRPAREGLAAELRRVLRPGGRVLVVDFAKAAPRKRDIAMLRRHRHRHGYIELPEVVGLLQACGFAVTESGAVGIQDLHYAVGVAPVGS
jgi:ubiquinone/menaquinone biosynthesis C-methylase UbiE